MNFQVKLIKKEQHKAVAPIIATLLMVAITVVGGILIFVFSQGFFKDTSIQSPSMDAIEIWGYNAQDIADTSFKIHGNLEVNCGGTVNQKIGNNDCFGIFIRNVGSNVVVIETLRVFGVAIPVETTATAVTNANPGAGEFCLVQNTVCSSNPLLQPGQEATVLVRNNAATMNGEIKIGRPMIFSIETGKGQIFTKQIKSGLSEGL